MSILRELKLHQIMCFLQNVHSLSQDFTISGELLLQPFTETDQKDLRRFYEWCRTNLSHSGKNSSQPGQL